MWELMVTSLFLGIGLAMDACAVSMTNGLNEPEMKCRKALLIAGTFALFQAVMPLLGWTCVSLVVDNFVKFAQFIPYIAFVLLAVIGGKMLYDGLKERKKTKDGIDTTAETAEESGKTAKKLTFAALLLQAVATSIDALSTGFSLVDIAGTDIVKALISVAVIAAVTFAICIAAVFLGKKFGDKLGDKAQILGGVVLLAIGAEILIKGIFF